MTKGQSNANLILILKFPIHLHYTNFASLNKNTSTEKVGIV